MKVIKDGNKYRKEDKGTEILISVFIIFSALILFIMQLIKYRLGV